MIAVAAFSLPVSGYDRIRDRYIKKQMNLISHQCQSKEPISSCSSKKPDFKNSTLVTMVGQYLGEYGNCYEKEDKWWGDKNITWSEAIERAWRSRLENGKMHGHQRRVAHKLEEGLEVSLSDNIQPDNFNNFESIYSWIKSVTDRVKGLGVTTAYDVARRLGAWLNMQPTISRSKNYFQSGDRHLTHPTKHLQTFEQ